MSSNAFDPEKLIDATAPLLGLDLAAASRATIALHLAVAARMAPLVVDFPLDDDAESAPVYTP